MIKIESCPIRIATESSQSAVDRHDRSLQGLLKEQSEINQALKRSAGLREKFPHLDFEYLDAKERLNSRNLAKECKYELVRKSGLYIGGIRIVPLFSKPLQAKMNSPL